MSVLHFPSNRGNCRETHSFTPNDDFQQLFSTEITDLFRLSLQLTANAEKAERCVIDAMTDCFGETIVARGFARVWARRMVICNAIRLVLNIDNDNACDAGYEFQLQPSGYRTEELRESVAVLDLPDVDRLAFVICVLERFSVLDCALLMRKSPKDVCDAVERATNRVASAEDGSHSKTLATFRTGTCNQGLVV